MNYCLSVLQQGMELFTFVMSSCAVILSLKTYKIEWRKVSFAVMLPLEIAEIAKKK